LFQAVHEEEVEEFIEVDGVVDDHDIGQNVLLHPNEVVISTGMREPEQPRYQLIFLLGRQIYYADNSVEGTDELCMNLPDLLSRTIVFTNGSKMFLCFSKRCRKQLAFEGHLYNINGFVSDIPANWNLWRCANPSCKGAIRTSPNITELRVREPHCSSCHPDDVQIRLRITVYDLRLMAEFTDLPLDALYHAYLDKVMNEHTDIVHLFPSFETLRSNLEDHRANLVYRKRFAGEARETDSQAMYYDSFGVAAGNSAVKFRRTKPFPPTMCMSCHAIFGSTPEVPSQDQLLEHMFFDHNRKAAVISRFTFADPGLFEQWVRELQYHSRYRLKKLCLHDEHMYYLCQNDIRHYKNHNRASVPDMHCTAFIRVLDWRVRTSTSVFMRELAARRERTQQLIQDKGLQRIKRRNQPPSFCGSFLRNFFKSNCS
uniref:C2H2-type domain-containing protein n=1 Tax=Haemonchus placei TaxID=6290 RepID=A0A0N4WB75_HAEPC